VLVMHCTLHFFRSGGCPSTCMDTRIHTHTYTSLHAPLLCAGIRRGLAVVGDTVPEFRGGRERLVQLEDRFAGMVEAPLNGG
jgi:hypothetical protein